MGMPPAVSLELTNNCNLRCPECFNGSGAMKREKGFMELALFEKIVEELRPYTLHLNLYFQGEPMLHPKFHEFLEKSKEFKTTVSTNGHFIDNSTAEKIALSGLSRLIISLDGTTEESYLTYRVGGDFKKVIEGIKLISLNIKKHSSSLKLVVQFLVNKQNENQIPQMKRFAKEVDARLELKSMQVITKDGFEKWMPKNKKFKRYEEIGGKYNIRNSLPNRCFRLWFNPVITWDGYLVPCCFDKDGNYKMGNLYDKSFCDLWNGPKYELFRNNLLSDRKSIDICSNCCSGIRGIKN
jgi:radical SAM protein with 4Fe4S-binding SPASM domain